MKQNQIKSDRLQEIQQEFSRGRHLGEVRKNFCPPELRALTVAAFLQGDSKQEIMQAAGISLSAVSNWISSDRKDENKKSKPPHPIELKVIKKRKAKDRIRPVLDPEVDHHALVQIYFRGGARMEVPVSALSAEFVTALNGGAL